MFSSFQFCSFSNLEIVLRLFLIIIFSAFKCFGFPFLDLLDVKSAYGFLKCMSISNIIAMFSICMSTLTQIGGLG